MIRNQQILLAGALAVVGLLVLLFLPREHKAGSLAPSPAPVQTASKAPETTEPAPRLVVAPRLAVAPAAPLGKPLQKATTPDEKIAALLSQRIDLSDPETRREVVTAIKDLEAIKHAELAKRAAEFGYPLVSEHGAVLTGFAGDTPLYDIAHNAESAVATGANLLHGAPSSVTGTGTAIGQWEVGGIPLLAHSEFGNRVTAMDGTLGFSLHASHVAGTMIAAGVDPLARGMAPAASILAHSSTNVVSELTALAAAAPGETGTIQISNHAYGEASGWEFNGTEWYGTFSDDGNGSNDYPQFFGQYTAESAAWDGLAWNAPYHLIFKSSGNHRDDAAPLNGTPWSLNGSAFNIFIHNPSHPGSDFAQETTGFGFGTIDPRSSAKNVMTVASVKDVVENGINRVPANGVSSKFSSAGPTDDGRIKPDLVADGDSLLSAGHFFEQHYDTSSGTSMAVASAAGSAALLTEHYDNLFPGAAMRSSSLKGLLLHTADDMGRPGPDYEFGWGLMNVKAAADLLTAHSTAGADRGHLVEEEISNLNDEDEYTFDYDGTEPLRITICWTDPAGNWTSGHDNRTRRLVHDLNLRLETPNHTTLRPYVMPFVGSWQEADLAAEATTGVNRVDNVEQIYLPNAAPGTYTIEVFTNQDLTFGSQEYSLMISGADLIVDPDPDVLNGVDDRVIFEADSGDLTAVADCNQVFSGVGLEFDASATEGIVTLTLNPDGTVDLFRVPGQVGTTTVTLTALDIYGRLAVETFKVSITSARFFVDASTPALLADQDGYGWSTAFGSLQDALAAAQPSQEIWVAEGVYYPDVIGGDDTNDRFDYFRIPAGVSIYGGFAGTEMTRALRDPANRLTILSGDIRQDDLQQPIASHLAPQSGTWNNSCNVVDLTDSVAGDIMDGFVITAGNGDQSGWNKGAGLWVGRGQPTIANCLVTGNEVTNDGAGLWLDRTNSGSGVRVLNCRFVGNKSAGNGGAIYFWKGELEMHNCEIRGNQATNGGGIYAYKDNFRLVNSVVSGNVASSRGGGLYVADGQFALQNCTFTGNRSSSDGGAIRIYKADELLPLLVENCVVWDNSANGSTSGSGASLAIRDWYNRPTVSHSLIANSGGSSSWDSWMGIDAGGNLDTDPLFKAGIDPSVAPIETGDFTLQGGSPAIDAGNSALLPIDLLDLDADGDTSELIAIDLAGMARVDGPELDLGAFEFPAQAAIHPSLVDSDGDGLSDEFEIAHFGDAQGLAASSDLDGDGLTALAEYVHGQNPDGALTAPIGQLSATEVSGAEYLTITYEVDPAALSFATVTVERRAALDSPEGWQEDKTVEVTSQASPTNPGMIQIVARSIFPMGSQRMEFLRIRHDAVSP